MQVIALNVYLLGPTLSYCWSVDSIIISLTCLCFIITEHQKEIERRFVAGYFGRQCWLLVPAGGLRGAWEVFASSKGGNLSSTECSPGEPLSTYLPDNPSYEAHKKGTGHTLKEAIACKPSGAITKLFQSHVPWIIGSIYRFGCCLGGVHWVCLSYMLKEICEIASSVFFIFMTWR